ncbi:hypothetical protein [Gramella sp. AN32]|uniref:Uncharacterized protein n=1 Tax=Christiangramia antarctica TaxID=2058158 RepID=A0ABW5X130_9FLAO|nr:hypothetical protein [Gramella sp. AN32]MCM4155721.1 hypothetical protein [Gramella sp. AN32]
MENLKTEIYPHDTDIDVTHKLNTIEIDYWISHLIYIKKEMTNLIGLCREDFGSNPDNEATLQKFNKKHLESETLLTALQNYKNSREDILECEDAQCDMAFVTEHESYRRNYLYYLDKYRRLKNDFFSKVQGKFTLLNGTS